MQSAFTGPDLSRDPQPADNLILWLPVFLCCGIGLYFLLPAEPSAFWIWGGFAASCAVMAVTWRMRYLLVWRWLVVAILAVMFGMGLMQWRAQNLDTQMLWRSEWKATVTGTIASYERAGAGWRVVLRDAHINDKPQTYTLRFSIRQRGFTPDVGGKLTANGSLMAPSPAMVPGAYDFRRHAFFHETGGYGYTTKILSYEKPSTRVKDDPLEEYRDWLTEKVYGVLKKQPEAGIVTALLNGQRAGIGRQTTSVLQKSGLQHVISISGLHVSIMAMTIFFTVRLLLALSMNLALRLPIKKIAAAVALVGIIFYLLIVGSSPPTFRSVLMTGAALIAVMLDREAIQMRVVALSALVILLLQPESLIDIGFQMSFAAVIGLVAFYQQTRNFWTHKFWKESILAKAAHILIGTIITSIVATIVTAPLVLLYFQQIPLLSMLANVMATPPITFLIMPGTFLTYLFAPVPLLGEWSIRMMGWGVTLMMDVAEFVAALPSAVWKTTPLPLVSVLLMMTGLFVIISVKNRLRWGGFVFVALGVLILPFFPRPDMYLTQSRLVLYPDPSSDIVYADGRVPGFDKTMILQWTGKSQVKPFACDAEICDLEINKRKIRLVRTVPALEHACDGPADIVVTRFYLDKPCAGALTLDRHKIDRSGGQAVWIGSKIRVETVRQRGGKHRLWQ